MAVQSRVRKGILRLEDTSGAEAFLDFSCVPTAVSIEPGSSEAGDSVEVLCGDQITDTSAAKSATLNLTAIQDFTDASGLQAYSWKNDGETVKFEWLPNGETDTTQSLWRGTVLVNALTVGGEVGQRLDTSATWAIKSLQLPPAFGSTWYIGGPSKAAATPGDVFPADATVTAFGDLTTAGYVANPQTAWTSGQKITVGTVIAHWSGTAWADGPAA